MGFVDALLDFLKGYFGQFSILSGLIMAFLCYTTAKKIFKILAFILIVVGIITFVPGLITGNA